MRKILAASIFLTVAACGGAARQDVFVMRYYTQRFSPPPRTLVLDAVPPRRFYAIAKLSAQKSEDAVIKLSEQARLLGADAIILGDENAQLVGPSPAAVGLAAAGASLSKQPLFIPPPPHMEVEVTALAIRFPESDQPAPATMQTTR